MALGRHRSRTKNELEIALDGLVEQLDRLGADAFLAMVASWNDQDPDAHADAWTTAEASARQHRLGAAVERARERVINWAESLGGGTYADITMYGGGWNPVLRDARAAAAPALVDVAVALALGDRLDPAARDVLLAPWRRATDRDER
jgi:hypothetical protein